MTPKEQFLETPHAAEHRKTVQSEAFREALNYATLELLGDIPNSADGAAQITGAQRFCVILRNLATPFTVPQGTHPPSINYDAYDRPRRTS